MDTKLLVTFIILNILNVIIQTVKSLVTVKCGKVAAAVVNAIAYGLYTIVIIYTVCDLPLYLKALIVAICNLVGVFVVKLAEEKARREKLWKVEMTVRSEWTEVLDRELNEFRVPHNYIENVGKYTVFNVYCATQKESAFVKEVGTRHRAKFFVSETKNF